MISKTRVAFLCACVSYSSYCQDLLVVQGTVRDGATLDPLVFANIAVAETQQGTTTDQKGTFSLRLPRGRNVLRCSYVGYKTVDVPVFVDRDTLLLINLDATDILLQDVVVYAYRGAEWVRRTESVLSLQSEEIKSSTAVIPDVLRSVQMLPGVSANNEFSARFNVRGGNHDENLLLLDGTQVYDPYHVKEVPNASISIMMMEMIKKMDLMTGGFPARYGDKMSSVASVEYREGNREQTKGTATVSLTDVALVAEGPLTDKGSFILGARKSYFEYLVKFLNRGTYHHPSFYDVQGVLQYSLRPGHNVLFKFLHAGDTYTQDPLVHHNRLLGPTSMRQTGDSLNNQGQYYSSLLSLQSINIISSSAIMHAGFSFYDQHEDERFWDNEYSDLRDTTDGKSLFDSSYTLHLYRNNLSIRTMELNSSLDWQISPSYDLKIGLSYLSITYDQDQLFQYTVDRSTNTVQFPDTTVTHDVENILDRGFNNRLKARSHKVSGFVENLVHFGDRLVMDIGGRFDYFDLNKAFTWSPRIQLAYRMRDELTLRGAWGFFHQSPNHRQIVSPIPSDTNTQPQKAIHYVLGADYHMNLSPHERHFLNAKIEAFYKSYDPLMSARLTSSGIVYYTRNNDAVGSAKGFDIHITYSGSGFYGWMSYGYLFSVQNALHDEYGPFPRSTDQRHTLAAIGHLDLGDQWSVSTRFVYGSGYPYTPLTATYDSARVSWQWTEQPPNSGRLPAYTRVDIRISKNFTLFRLAASAFLDISNVLNTRNIQSFRYTRSRGEPVIEETRLWPIIPSVGISVRF